jgi:hypothetical protein
LKDLGGLVELLSNLRKEGRVSISPNDQEIQK